MFRQRDNYKVEGKIEKHYDKACELYGEKRVIGVYLYGSQNYGLDTEESDVDTRCIIVPTLEDIALNRPMVSKTVEVEDGMMDVKDIRLFLENLKKMNPNSLEVLYTSYYKVNSDYDIIFHCELKSRRHNISESNPYQLLQTVAGMARNHYKAIEKAGEEYNTKDLYHLFRYERFLKRFIENFTFYDSLKFNYYDWDKTPILEAKSGAILKTVGLKEAKKAIEKIDEVYAKGVKDFIPGWHDTTIDKIFERVAIETLRFALGANERDEKNETDDRKISGVRGSMPW